MEWIDAIENPPKYKRSVLLRMIKKGKVILTEGYLIDNAIECASKSHPVEFWRQHGYGEQYMDYAGRLLLKLSSKSKNKITHYMILEDEN